MKIGVERSMSFRFFLTLIFYLWSFMLLPSCSVVGIRTAEELKYEVLLKDSSFEIRQYASHIAARASLEGDYKSVQRPLFRLLAGYIFGKNTTDEKIAMTAPVIVDGTSIAMTAPVAIKKGEGDRWEMAFSMPAKYSMETLPRPLDERVLLTQVPERTVAVLRFPGSFGDLAKRKSKLEDLMKWLENRKDYQASGRPVFAGYDPPFTLPFLRRNEVMVEVKKVLQ